MNSIAYENGCDVAKDTLEFCVQEQKPFRVSNDLLGIGKAIFKLPPGSCIHMEASGGYERLAKRLLTEAGFRVHVHNPRKTHKMSQACSVGAKTDPIDAKHLSRCGKLLKPSLPKSDQRESLCQISRAIQQLAKDIANYRKRLAMPELCPQVKEGYKATIEAFKATKKQLEDDFSVEVKQSSLYESYKLMLTVPDIGPVAARVMVCEFAEDLSEIGPGQIAAYAGVAPVDNASGKTVKTSHTKPGNKHLKGVLGMPALGAITRRVWAQDLYSRLVAKGKGHECALVAVMRRLLIQVLAVVKRGSAWQAEPPRELTK